MSFHQDEQKENSQEIVIPLTQGKVTRISRDDEHFAQYKWYFNAKRGYVQRDREKDGKITKSFLHREIVEGIIGRPLKKNEFIDHINGDKLDNRRENLSQPIDASEYKQRTVSRRNQSGYKGVFYNKKRKKWEAQITKNYHQKTIGRYNTPEEAARAYNDAALKLYGEKAYINKICENGDE